jgi:probable HAF family extracellular repeat protein
MISRTGQVVGEGKWPTGDLHATVWPAGRGPIDLGTLPGDTTSRMFEGSPDGRASGASFNADQTFVRAAYWPGHGPLKTLPPFGNPAWGSAAHGVDDYGEVQGVTVRDLATEPVGDIPTLWTDADAQAFVPGAATHTARTSTTPAAALPEARSTTLFPTPTLHRLP